MGRLMSVSYGGVCHPCGSGSYRSKAPATHVKVRVEYRTYTGSESEVRVADDSAIYRASGSGCLIGKRDSEGGFADRA
jgi:hypothetical protein